ncbi:peptide ABC transporter substrate-binding protein [Levilactobacillus namurensis]|uniref:Peptide ABC transporter substrate-binding protein n=1 Tax=Levilactobacillus namurensis TaxID=380393 RepID=A0AAW8W3T2_9LACO|nr:peptide ABC transporter substrate-binding protein [Levilactobacillus namurensis]MDT7013398.1 peptide ABC transporter substrate-binding protein [Levilactobacillus namurensis]
MSIFNRKTTTIAICGIVLIGGAFAIKAHSAETPKATAQRINLYQSSPITSLDTARITDSVSSGQLEQAGEGLYRLNADSQAVNALAKKTTVSPDGKHYTIDLKTTGKWSNGDPVTAQNFVYSWRRTLDPKSKSEFTYQFANIQNANAIAAGKLAPSKLGVQATGKYQLKITLAKPASYFKQMLASTTYYPLDPKAVHKYGRKYGTSADTTVYNGPYTVSGWNGTNDTWTLKKNPTYRDKHAIKLTAINYQVIKSPSTSYNLYQSHKLAQVTLSGEQAHQNQTNKALKTLASGRIGFIQYNQKNPLTANRELRTALSLAVNRQQLVTKVLQNGSRPAATFAVRNMAKNPKTGADFTQDATVANTASYQPAKAKAHFQTALKQLHRSQIKLTLTCGDDDATQQIAEYLQTTLMKQLPNLTISIKAVPFPSMLSAVSKGNFEANLTSWSMDFADPINSLEILESTNNSNMGHYRSTTYDNALKAAEGADALKPAQRYQDLVKAAKTAMTDQAVTPLYDARTSILADPNVKGVVYNKFNGQADYRTAYVD